MLFIQGQDIQPLEGFDRLSSVMKVLDPADRAIASDLLLPTPNVFAFSSQVVTAAGQKYYAGARLPQTLDLPFSSCLVELFSTSAGFYGTQFYEKGRTEDHTPIRLVAPGENPRPDEIGGHFAIPTLVVKEIAPTHYRIFGIVASYLQKMKVASHWPFVADLVDGRLVDILPRGGIYASEPAVLEVISSGCFFALYPLSRLHEFESGIERAAIRSKVRVDGVNHHVKIKEIIHIRPKTQSANSEEFESREIDWSHRWEVRGHWRKISGIGKDREGAYKIGGHTWVVPHQKGPDHLPVVRKLRVLNPQSEVSHGR